MYEEDVTARCTFTKPSSFWCGDSMIDQFAGPKKCHLFSIQCSAAQCLKVSPVVDSINLK